MKALRRAPFTTALFVHAWDLEDGNAARLTQWARSTGLDTLCVSATYHSGWLIQPHHATKRLRWSESGAAYFHPDERFYPGTCLRPPVAATGAAFNHLRAAADAASDQGLHLVAWTVGAHNTRLGLAFPELTQHNAYGDILPHALSLGHNASRNYLKALVRDIAANYSPYGIQLESFQWHSIRHNHAHERDLVGLSPMEQQLLSLCFNPQTVRKAEAAGVDAEAARHAVKQTLETAFRHAPERPLHYPQTIEELEEIEPDLRSYRRFLRQLSESLIAEIRQESLSGTTCRLYLQSGYTPALRDVCDGFAVWAYGQTPEQTYRTVREAIAPLPDDWEGEYHCYIRLGMGVPTSPEQLREILLAARSAGATGIYLYNYSESPPAMLGWLPSALASLAGAKPPSHACGSRETP